MASRDIKFLVKDIKEATVRAAREAAVEIMNGLAKAGPVHTGAFSSAWYAVADDAAPGGPRSTGRIYTYTLRNVPKVRFNKTGLYKIINGAEHADEAMDLVPHTYEDFKDVNPLKPRLYGMRTDGATRGDLAGRGPNWRTAPADWWPTFNSGGRLQSLLTKGATKGFLTFGKAQGFG